MKRNWMLAMKQAVAVCGSRPRIILMVALLMGAALLVMPGAVPMAEAAACCRVTAVSGNSVSAVDTKTETTFEFTLTKPVSLRVGDAVYANFSKKDVSCDGKSICGTITSISPRVARTPVTPKTEGTTEGSGAQAGAEQGKGEPRPLEKRIPAHFEAHTTDMDGDCPYGKKSNGDCWVCTVKVVLGIPWCVVPPGGGDCPIPDPFCIPGGKLLRSAEATGASKIGNTGNTGGSTSGKINAVIRIGCPKCVDFTNCPSDVSGGVLCGFDGTHCVYASDPKECPKE